MAIGKMRGLSPCSFSEAIPKILHSVSKKVALFAYSFFQVFISILSFRLNKAIWESANAPYLETLPAFFLKSPPIFVEKKGLLAELLREYQILAKVDDESLSEHISNELKKGLCHGEAVGLVRLMIEKETELARISHEISEQIAPLSPHLGSVSHEHSTHPAAGQSAATEERFVQRSREKCGLGSLLPALSSNRDVIQMELLEIFRPAFEKNERNDLIEKMHKLLPKGIYDNQLNISHPTALESLHTPLSDFKGLALIRLYSKGSAHTVLMQVDCERQIYSFYNPCSKGGCYNYPSLGACLKAVWHFAQSEGSYTDWNVNLIPL